MKKFFIVAGMLLIACGACWGQVERPKLVVGIVVDQMRWDYLYRYQSRYSEGGFKRLLREGYSCESAWIPYIPSITAVGHTTIYTGSLPSITGIVGNNFVIDGVKTYCTDDASVEPVGTTSAAGRMSPRNLQTTTIGDELRIATNGRSKVVGVALKDRAAILPAGKNPTGSYWFDDSTGNFITSTYYAEALPEWVEEFNAARHAEEYLSKVWEPLYDIDTYEESTEDNSPNYEKSVVSGVPATLPLDLPTLFKERGYTIIRNTPFGNSLTFDMAKAAVKGENLGGGTDTDLLAVSCSSTDYVGHQVGTHAVETEDMYLRLDLLIADFLSYLDDAVGEGNYLVFLSADHGAMNNPQFLSDRRIDAGLWSESEARAAVNGALAEVYPDAGELVKYAMNYQLFFDMDKIDELGLDYDEIKKIAIRTLEKDERVLYVCDQEKTAMASIPEPVKQRIINGYNRLRSGGVQVVTKPRYYHGSLRGTDHGMWNPYDTHIPLVFMGWGIEHGSTTRKCSMTDIAATVAALLHIQMPDGCVGQSVFE